MITREQREVLRDLLQQETPNDIIDGLRDIAKEIAAAANTKYWDNKGTVPVALELELKNYALSTERIANMQFWDSPFEVKHRRVS